MLATVAGAATTGAGPAAAVATGGASPGAPTASTGSSFAAAGSILSPGARTDSNGISNFDPHRGQIPRLPARNVLTFSL